MNREHVEAVACDVRGMVRERLPKGCLMVCVLAAPTMEGLVIASSLDPEELKKFFALLADSPSRITRLRDLEEGEG